MNNQIACKCSACGTDNTFLIEEGANETLVMHCANCDAGIATVGQLHARIAQQALGLGATDLRDDHVPVGGELGERPGQ